MTLTLNRRNQSPQLCAPNVKTRMRVTGVWVVAGSGPERPLQPLGERERETEREAADKRLATAWRLYTCMHRPASPWAPSQQIATSNADFLRACRAEACSRVS
jgi:hypothetical protein